jgi:phosphoribosylformylglycinamidine cyclo-ligase
VSQADLEGTFNMGIGMVAVTEREAADAAVQTLAAAGLPAWLCGEVRDRATGESGDAAAKGGGGGAVSVV